MADLRQCALCVMLLGICGVVLPAPVPPANFEPEPSGTEAYKPVAPARAILFALRLNLKVAGDWIRDDDFDSAVETVERVRLLSELAAFQSIDPAWRRGVTELQTHSANFIEHAKRKGSAESRAALDDCLKTIKQLNELAPAGGDRPAGEFENRAPVRAFMKLLDGSYSDAKIVKSVDELVLMAFTIAETANAVQLLRDESSWRERAGAVRDAALEVAALKPDADLKVARQQLKNVYERCQACHKEFKR